MPRSGLQLFVYGTLKRGQRSHQRFCGRASAVEPATVWGRLYHLPAGYPMLCVPEPSIRAIGTGNALADLATQRQFDRLMEEQGGEPLTPAEFDQAGDWEPIEGEIVTFADPAEALPRLDVFEDFRPGSDDTSYLRALVPLADRASMHVWTYIAPGGRLPAGARRVACRWP